MLNTRRWDDDVTRDQNASVTTIHQRLASTCASRPPQGIGAHRRSSRTAGELIAADSHMREAGELGEEVAWRSMNSYDPLIVVLENEIGEPLRTHGVTVQANDYRSAPLHGRYYPSTPVFKTKQDRTKQASQEGIGLLKSSESARRSPIDAPLNRTMHVSKKHADDESRHRSRSEPLERRWEICKITQAEQECERTEGKKYGRQLDLDEVVVLVLRSDVALLRKRRQSLSIHVEHLVLVLDQLVRLLDLIALDGLLQRVVQDLAAMARAACSIEGVGDLCIDCRSSRGVLDVFVGR
jgi:hypothetical protein